MKTTGSRSRVKGRSALVKRLGLLLIAVNRYAQHRATSADERQWAARVLDALRGVLDAAGVLPVDTRSAPAHAGATGISTRSEAVVTDRSGLETSPGE